MPGRLWGTEAPILDYMSRALNKDDDIKGAPSLEKMLGDLFRLKAESD